METYLQRDPYLCNSVANYCRTALTGIGPANQSAVLAELTATFFAGIHPDARNELIDAWMRAMRELLAEHPANEEWLGRMT